MNDQQKLKLDELLEDYKDAVLKAYSWREYSGVYYLHKLQLEHAVKQAIFDYFENEDSWCHAGNHYTERHKPRPSWCPLEEVQPITNCSQLE